MCMNLLKKLAATKLPCTVPDAGKIDRLRVLDAAGRIKVLIPAVRVDCDDHTRQAPAIVLEITASGWKSLEASAVEEERPLAPSRLARPKRSSAALDDLAQLAAWFRGSKRRPRS